MIKKTSAWQEGFDACPSRTEHLRDALVTHLAGANDGDLDEALGLEVLLLCLAHRFDLDEDEIEDLRYTCEESWRYGNKTESPTYEGGDPRLPDGSGWYSTVYTENVAEAIATEFETDHDIATVWCSVEDMEDWTVPLSEGAIGGLGYLTYRYWDADCRYMEAVLATWAPATDREVRRANIMPQLWGWIQTAAMGANRWSLTTEEPDLFVDCVMSKMSAEDLVSWGVVPNISWVLEDAEFWKRRGCVMPTDDWWSAPTEEGARQRLAEDPAFHRQLAAVYEARAFEDRFGERLDDDEDDDEEEDDESDE